MERLFPGDSCIQYRVFVAQNYLRQTNEEYRRLEEEFQSKTISDKERREISAKIHKYVTDGYVEVSSISTKLSNLLEYMCICFNTNIADDETVYQSLHKVFFLAVHMIYIFTFDANTNEHDRVFYNVMILYKKWKKVNQEKKAEEEKNKENLEREMNSLKARYHEKIPVSTRCE